MLRTLCVPLYLLFKPLIAVLASLCPKAFAISVATAHHSPSFSTNLISWLHHFSIFIKSPPF
nr:MAG TPA: hypothetical protein [Caudoviricetes sp.]